MRAALERLLGDAGLRERMGAAARTHAAGFSPEAVVPRFEEAYEAAIQRRSRR
jgi:glycosyltransferase involved in cell wall biosynthesis